LTDYLRIDKWLWYARFSKTRSLAQSLCVDGRITLNGKVVRKANRAVRVGDTVTILVGPTRRTVEVKAMANRRGPAAEAHGMYEELAPPQSLTFDEREVPFHRLKGRGRPTKKNRRALERLVIFDNAERK